MNGDLRQAIYKKHMLFNKYKKCKTPLNWDNYRKQSNLVTKIKRKSIRVYFYERCAGGPKSKDFWPTIKPFLSKKGSDGGNEIILCENDKIVSDQGEVCNIFNKYFVNVAKEIANDATQYDQDFLNHPSIQKILENTPKDSNEKFSFKPTTETYVHKVISNLDPKKATGVDNISAKILKSCVSSVSGTISNLINATYESSKFPSGLKGAQVVPLFKKKDPLNKENFRPVSLLPVISKIYERSMHEQLSDHLNASFHPFLAAFRKGFGCQSTLLRLLEDWRKALDNQQCVGAILMDLSKAFDCLPHRLLTAKLKAYGLSEGAAKLLDSYLEDRSQQIRLGTHTSSWEKLFKGVPQGSILGRLLFNTLSTIYFISLANAFYIITLMTILYLLFTKTLQFLNLF